MSVRKYYKEYNEVIFKSLDTHTLTAKKECNSSNPVRTYAVYKGDCWNRERVKLIGGLTKEQAINYINTK